MQVRSGESLLVNGAAGGVGSHALQIGKALGARVPATASAGRAGYLRELGAEAVIDYRTEDVPSRAAEIAGGSLDTVLDLVGGRFIESVLPFVRLGGRIAVAVDLKGDIDPALDRNVTIHGVLVRPSRQLLQSLQELIVGGDLKPVVNTVSPLSDVRAVHQRLDQRHGQGKTVIAMPILTEGRLRSFESI